MTGGGSPRAAARLALPLLLLACLAAAKVAFDPVPFGHRRADGTFYTQIAQHVAAGEGVLTSVSLHAKGLRELPAPTAVQPLWPLLLGGAARLVGLERAAWLVPELLFLLDLLLLYLLANRVGRALGAEVLLRVRGRPILDLGALAVALFGTNAVFFAYTSMPYTEGLAFALLFGSLLALPAPGARAPLLRAAAAGALAAAAYLTRSQFIGLPFALAAALGWVGLRHSHYRRLAAVSLVASALVVAPWIVHLLRVLDDPPLRVVIDFTAYRETPELPPFVGFRQPDGVAGRVRDVAAGLLHSLHPTRPQTYSHSFGPVALAVPLALMLAALTWLRRRELPSPAPQDLPVAAAVLAGAVALAPVHLAHANFPYEWFFHWRHGLPFVVLLIPALAVLFTRGRAWTWLAAAVLAFSVLVPRVTPDRYVNRSVAPMPGDRALVEWLDAHPSPPVLLTTEARALAAWSDAVSHAIRCRMGGEEVRAYLRLLPIDYVVVYPLQHCAWARALEDELELVRAFGPKDHPIRVLRWKASG